MSSPGAAPRHTLRELLLATLFFLAFTVVMTWPLAARLGDGLTDLWDAKLNAWILQWDVRQALSRPLDLFQAPFFHPARDVLAFSENLVGAAVFGVPLMLSGASAVLNYNVLLLLGMFLSALAAWALARDVTGDAGASVVAGLVYAFLPWRFSQHPHLQFQWGAFLCLAVLFLLRYLRSGGRRDLILFAVSFAWNALSNVHYAIFSGFAVGVALLVHAAFSAPPERARRISAALVATFAGALPFVPFALAYRRASERYGMVRWLGEVEAFSGRWTDFLSAGPVNRTWGPLTSRWWHGEGDFFPGLTALTLAVIAVVLVRRPPPQGLSIPPRRASGALRILDAACALTAALFIAALLRSGLRLGPVRVGDAGRVLVILTALVALRVWLAVPLAERSERLPELARRSRADPTLAYFVLLAGVGIVIALGVHTPYYKFLFVSVSAVFRAIRGPARGIVLFDLALAVLAAWGLAIWRRGRTPTVRRAILGAAVIATGFEYRAFPLRIHDYDPAPPAAYRWARGLDLSGGALVEWPIGPADAEYVLRQADHRQKLVNGYSGFFPPDYLRLDGMLRRKPIPEEVWSAMRGLGARVLIYHPASTEPSRRGAYRLAIRRALGAGRVSLARAFAGPAGTDFAFRLEDAPNSPAASAADARSVAQLEAFLAAPESELTPPMVAVDFPVPVAPGAWHGGWAVDDSGVAEIRIASELGPAGLALLHMRHPGTERAFPDFEEARGDRAGFGFNVPNLPPGRHTLTITVVANDGGVTVVTRPIEVLPAR